MEKTTATELRTLSLPFAALQTFRHVFTSQFLLQPLCLSDEVLDWNLIHQC